MITLRIILRQSTCKYIKPKASCTNFSSKNTSSSSSSSDDEKQNSSQKKKSEEALKKLNLLLTQMIGDDKPTSQQKSKLDLAKPVNRRKQNVEAKLDSEKNVGPEKQMLNAVKEVAQVIGGDVKQTESELLQKLLNPAKEELATANNLSELFKDMKIDRDSKPVESASRAQQVRQLLQFMKTKQSTNTRVAVRKSGKKYSGSNEYVQDQIVDERVNLFGNKSLGIFPSITEVNTWPKHDINKTWKALEERELRLAVTHPPANYFQQMIQWTEQGKIWKFPIDNEQGLEAEKSIHFTEHVFLEKHIDSWCPPKGPLRHFMELVLVGLSKNPYLTVEHKKEHIEWFRNYFDEKKSLLHEVAAIPEGFEFVKNDSKKLES